MSLASPANAIPHAEAASTLTDPSNRTMSIKNNNLTADAKVTRSIGRNTIFGVVSNFAQIGTRLITVPIVIHYLGLGGYGIWNIIMMTATYMRFGSVGVKTAFQKYVAEATGNGDYERANKLLSTGAIIMLVLSVCGLIPVALFSLRIATLARRSGHISEEFGWSDFAAGFDHVNGECGGSL